MECSKLNNRKSAILILTILNTVKFKKPKFFDDWDWHYNKEHQLRIRVYESWSHGNRKSKVIQLQDLFNEVDYSCHINYWMFNLFMFSIHSKVRQVFEKYKMYDSSLGKQKCTTVKECLEQILTIED